MPSTTSSCSSGALSGLLTGAIACLGVVGGDGSALVRRSADTIQFAQPPPFLNQRTTWTAMSTPLVTTMLSLQAVIVASVRRISLSTLQSSCIAWNRAIVVRVVDEFLTCVFAGMHTPLSYLCDTYFDPERLTDFDVLVAKQLSHIVGAVRELTKVDFFVSFLDNKVLQGHSNDMCACLAVLPTFDILNIDTSVMGFVLDVLALRRLGIVQ